ncbi:MAG: hypothetical protein MJ078_05475, partial [Clostridia bacterium]|nr:hypothetical protein [Clostridia bacterium]
YLLSSLAAGIPLPFVIVFSSVLFPFIGAGGSFLMTLNQCLLGVFLSLLVLRRGSLYAALFVRGFFRFAEGLLAGLPVAGTSFPAGLLLFSVSSDKAGIAGSGFGPEGSIGFTCILTLGILILLMSKSKEDTFENQK